MRVLQLIDSLEAGGAERMTVNIANALSRKIEFSGLCATRKEGNLKEGLDKSVHYLFLNRKRTLDISAIIRLKKYIRKHNVEVIHAHATSFFLATLVKLFYPNVQIIWHDHFGNSEFLVQRKTRILKWCSRFLIQIISVNPELKNWAEITLSTSRVAYIQNFAIKQNLEHKTNLKGEKGKRILHLGNLRPQKDHSNLMNAFKNLLQSYPDWTLHCVGKDFEDEYSISIKKQILDLGIQDSVYLYGSKKDVGHIIAQSTICVLSSKSEGLPIALLEYGLYKKPVVVTNVGACAEVVENGANGIVVEKENSVLLADGMIKLIENPVKASEMSMKLSKK